MIDDYLNISVVSKGMRGQTVQLSGNAYNQGNGGNRTALAPVMKQSPSSSLLGSWEPNYQLKTKK